MLAWILALTLAATDPSVLTVPIVKAAELTPQEIWINALADCESQASSTIKVLDTDGYFSYGLVQFHMATWLKFGKKFGAAKANIYDGDLQKKVARDMLDAGLRDQWFNCANRLTTKIGDYPTTTPSK